MHRASRIVVMPDVYTDVNVSNPETQLLVCTDCIAIPINAHIDNWVNEFAIFTETSVQTSDMTKIQDGFVTV